MKTATTITVHVDGYSVSSNESAGSITNSAPLRIGHKTTGDDVYNGVMDEVSIEFTPSVEPSPSPNPSPSGETCLGQTATIVGTANGESITGTEGADVISAGGGNDRSSGGAGNDTLTDQSGTDVLRGDSNSDTLNAGDGQGGDTVNGGVDSDTCTADANDSVPGCETLNTP